MSWTLGSVVITPGDKGDTFSKDSFYAVQNPVGAVVATISYYGADSERRTLHFVLFENFNGGTGISTLKTLVDTDADVALVSDQGAQGNYRIMKLSGSRIQDLTNTSPVWDCQAELIKV